MSISVASYDKNTSENFQEFYDSENLTVFTLSKIVITYIDSTIFKLNSTQFSKFHFPIFNTFEYIGS